MRKLNIAAAAASLLALASFAAAPPSAPPAQAATTCFKNGEYTSGMNRICLYNCLGSQAAITIPVTQICPLTIQQ